jgi:hypothetical protein
MNWPDDYLIPAVVPYHVEEAGIIYCGDCRDILPDLPKVDLVLTDPPYGKNYYPTDKNVDLVLEKLFSFARVVILFGWPEPMVANCCKWNRIPDEWITWAPTNGRLRGMNGPNGLWRESEVITVFGKVRWGGLCDHVPNKNAVRVSNEIAMRLSKAGDPGKSRWPSAGRMERRKGETLRRTGDVWIDASPSLLARKHLRNHPNEKPLNIMKRLIQPFDSNDIILDPFLGSGTTAVAAKELGRKFIGIEICEEYCAIAVKRLRQGVLNYGRE